MMNTIPPRYSSFEEFFESATGKAPFPYQTQMASGQQYVSVLSVPTGLGKTAAAVLTWLWRRRFADARTRESTPRRLVYCLPARVLVEQTRDEAVLWLCRLGLLGGQHTLGEAGVLVGYDAWGEGGAQNGIRVHTLMGGETDRDWDAWPEADAILVGTQDMLLSRALNRGYAQSRYRWPVSFGLLNSDCLWVLDEVQLMGPGLTTATQLQAFRRQLGTLGSSHTLWMSATLDPGWLKTTDSEPSLDAPCRLALGQVDAQIPLVRQRVNARKTLSLSQAWEEKELAELILSQHQQSGPGTRTLAVFNTVKRAQAVWGALKKRKPAANLVLLHSQFREDDRHLHMQQALAGPGESGTIVISTQVIEAGVNMTSAAMVTELAPWSSMVQRFGRCNRGGELPQAPVVVVVPKDLAKSPPYKEAQLQQALDILGGLDEVGPSALPTVEMEREETLVVRRKDIVELFDTTPDLAGADLDISRFVRDCDDHQAWLFWRNLKDTPPSPNEPAPSRHELCPAPLAGVVKSVEKNRAYRWDHLDKRWARVDKLAVRPGLVLMMDAAQGGYEPDTGVQLPPKGKPVVPLTGAGSVPEEGDDSDYQSRSNAARTLAQHTSSVTSKLEALLAQLPAPAPLERQALLDAAIWHDVGKAHEVFQAALRSADSVPESDAEVWAKSRNRASPYSRTGFRHELASALALLQHGGTDLAAYLVASHHGRVRLSIRSMPHETPPSDASRRFARGIHEGDLLPSIRLVNGHETQPLRLDLSLMEMGEGPQGPSWLARMLVLRDMLGPFRLAALEAWLRAADWRASREEEANHESV